jgi:hypothetical protein
MSRDECEARVSLSGIHYYYFDFLLGGEFLDPG